MSTRFPALVLVVIIGFSMLSMIRLSGATAVVTVKVDPAKVPGRIGKIIEFNVYISGIDEPVDLFSWALRVNWVDIDFNFVSVEEGPFLAQGGFTYFVYSTSTAAGVEYVSLGCTLLGRVPGVKGEGVLATVRLYVVAGSPGSAFDLSTIELYSSDLLLIAPPKAIVYDESGEFCRVPKNCDIVPPYGVIDTLDLGVIGANYELNITSVKKIATSWRNLTNPGWRNPYFVGASDNLYAAVDYVKPGSNSSMWGDFWFVVNTTLWTGVAAVKVGLETWKSYVAGDVENITISLSNDNGTTWSPTTKDLSVTTDTDTFTLIDVSGAYTPWTPTMIRSIAVKLTYKTIGTVSAVYIDYLVVWVYPKIGSPPSPVTGPDAFDPDADVNNDLMVNMQDLIEAALEFGSYPIGEEE